MKFNQQQVVADTLEQYQAAYVVGALNAYELAGRLLDAARQAEVEAMGAGIDAHDCKLDEWLSGDCPHPSHSYELLEQRPPSESEAYRFAK